MLSRKLVALAVLVITPAALCAAEPENPFKKAEKGQWVTMKTTGKVAGMEIAGTVKRTITAKSDKSVTVEAVITFAGQELPKQTKTIDLTKPFDPMTAINLPIQGKTKVEKKDSGKESVEVGGKKYEAEWTNYNFKIEVMNNTLEGTLKVWISKDAPFDGVVKTETKLSLMGQEIEGGSVLDSSGKD